MALTDHVQLTLSVTSTGIARAGFGVPLILSHTASFPDRVRTYTSLLSVASDFGTLTPEYRAARALLSQTPKPTSIRIGKASSTAVIQKYTIDAAAIRNSEAYTITVEGNDYDGGDATYTSDSGATQAEIHNGLVTALNAITSNNYVAAFAALVYADDTFTAAASDICTNVAHGLSTGDGPFQLTSSGTLPAGLALATDYWIVKLDADTFSFSTSLALALAGTVVNITDAGTGTHTISDTVSTVRPEDPFTVTADASGEWFSLEVYDPTALSIAQTHTVTGLATDLDAILLADPSWYCLLPLYNSTDYALETAAWTEANKRICVLDTNETEAITTVVGSGNDTQKQLHALGYVRTMYSYHQSPAQMFSAAWMGRWLSTEPGAATPKFKTLSGIVAPTLTDTHWANLIARRANGYQEVTSDRTITREGTVASTTYRFLDVVRNFDWHEDDMSKGLFGMLADQDIVGMDTDGITQAEAELRAGVQRAINKKVATDDPAPEFTIPEREDLDDADVEERTLAGLAYSFTLRGAVHKIRVTGTLSF